MSIRKHGTRSEKKKNLSPSTLQVILAKAVTMVTCSCLPSWHIKSTGENTFCIVVYMSDLPDAVKQNTLVRWILMVSTSGVWNRMLRLLSILPRANK